jgi:hypothetical protein
MPCLHYETPEEISRREKLQKQNLLAPLKEEISVLREELSEREAMLCAILSSIYHLDGYIQKNMILKDYFSNAVREWFDETEAGVTWEQVESWWHEHKTKDQRRLDEVRKNALSKLSSEERVALGLK